MNKRESKYSEWSEFGSKAKSAKIKLHNMTTPIKMMSLKCIKLMDWCSFTIFSLYPIA
ncbi:MAG: hypothetical protein NWQ54_25340 [Paraglaciecola sp.]|nr:hypothetical protein [Paraglaciecola sp.]